MQASLWLRAGSVLSMLVASGVAAGSVTPSTVTPLITLTLKDAPARDAVAYVARATGLNLSPLWRDPTHPEGLDPDRSITLTCRATTPMRALEQLISRLDPDTTWQPDDQGAIEIAPRPRLNERQLVRVYDIHDLLSRAPDYTDCPGIDLQSALRASSASIFKDPETPRAETPRPTPTEDLITLITTTIEPDQWSPLGGPATIRALQGTLIIKAPPYIHRQIASTIH
jgi:hypothetical protein